MTCIPLWEEGATAAVWATPALIAVASWTVSVGADPVSLLTPPEVVDPGVTVRRLVPNPLRLFKIVASVPLPIDIKTMTAPTPITTPRMVRKLLNLCVDTAVQAVARGLKKFFILFPRLLFVRLEYGRCAGRSAQCSDHA